MEKSTLSLLKKNGEVPFWLEDAAFNSEWL